MEVLKVSFDDNSYSISYVYWNGTGTNTLPSSRKVEPDIMIYKNKGASKLPTPWFVKTSNIDCEALILYNSLYYPITVIVDNEIYIVEGMTDKVVPIDIYLSKQFVQMCESKSVYDVKSMRSAYSNLCSLTWCTGVNAFLELI